VDFGVIDQRPIKFSIFGRYWRKTGSLVVIDFKKAYDSVRREVLYNIFIEFRICRKQAGLIKICLNETYNTMRIGKYQSDKFPI
jgi:hypothetical protein